MLPEITVDDLSHHLQSSDPFTLLDVRETWELDRARITDDRLVNLPMSLFAEQGVDALPDPLKQKDTRLFVICHHGVRSADVTAWLASQGWTNVFSVAGGIDAYARRIDPSVGRY